MLTDSLFIQADYTWDLERLTQAIIEIKNREASDNELTTLEHIVLCSLLCGYHPNIIAQQLPVASPSLIIHLIVTIQSYLEQIVVQKLALEPNEAKNTNILNLLAVAGYKKSINRIETKTLENYSVVNNQNINTEIKSIVESNNFLISTSKIEAKLPLNNTYLEKPSSISSNFQSVNNSQNNHSLTQDNQLNESLANNNTANNYFLSTINSEIVPSVSRWTTIGGLVTMGLVGIAFTLATTIKYDVTVKAEATVRPEGEIKLVQASREGRIKSIQVKENQQVKQGEIVAYLDDWELQNQSEQLATNLRQSKLQLTQIDAQINSLETQIVAETEKSNRSIISAEAEFKSTQTEYQQNKLTTQAQVKEATAKLNIARQELAKAKTELNSVEANLKSSQAALASASKKRDRYQKILSSGAISQEQFEEAQLAVQQQLQTVESQKATVLGQKQTIERQKQEIAAASAQLSRSQAALNPDYAVVEIAQQEIEREKANKRTTIASHFREKEALIQQRLEIEKQIAKEQQQLQQLAQEINQSIIRATADGTVLKLNLRNHNQVVNPQDSIAEIAPTSSNLVVKARINPQDRDRLTTEQSVKLKIDACPYPDYGILSGKVTAISADTVTDKDNEQKYYTAEISPAAGSLTRGGKACQLRSGMSATANIITQTETPLQFFLRQARLITDW